jgi:hypothetical protein
MDDLARARQLLSDGGYTCVLCKGDRIYTSTHRGVKPLMDLLDTDVSGYSAADKVVGKATALLYCLLRIECLHAGVISDAALQVLDAYKIPVQWDHRVAFIQNRTGTGRCPMETATEHICDPADAPAAIRNKLKELQG